MKIYFSLVSSYDVDNFGDEGLLGPNEAGDFFYNEVEFGTNSGGLDEVAISDGCGRYIPICVDTIPELIAALSQIHSISAHITEAQKLIAIAESQTAGYVYEEYVHFDGESVQNTISQIAY